jgi:hypothetical protein
MGKICSARGRRDPRMRRARLDEDRSDPHARQHALLVAQREPPWRLFDRRLLLFSTSWMQSGTPARSVHPHDREEFAALAPGAPTCLRGLSLMPTTIGLSQATRLKMASAIATDDLRWRGTNCAGFEDRQLSSAASISGCGH